MWIYNVSLAFLLFHSVTAAFTSANPQAINVLSWEVHAAYVISIKRNMAC